MKNLYNSKFIFFNPPGIGGFEPTLMILKTTALPLSYTPFRLLYKPFSSLSKEYSYIFFFMSQTEFIQLKNL